MEHPGKIWGEDVIDDFDKSNICGAAETMQMKINYCLVLPKEQHLFEL